jgi:hypothetical protein
MLSPCKLIPGSAPAGCSSRIVNCSNSGPRVLAVTIGIGLAAGLGLAVLAIAPSRWIDQGMALYLAVVGVGVLPTVVVAGWAALVLHRRSHPHWLALPTVALMLDCTVVALLLLSQVYIMFTWAALLVLLCCQMVAAVAVPVRAMRCRAVSAWYVAAGAAWPPVFLLTLYLMLGVGEDLLRHSG